ncbi:MAG: hypothetical protein ACE5G9_13675 [Nitrospinales bacterium]
MRPLMPRVISMLWILALVSGAPVERIAPGLHGHVKVCAAYDFVNRKCKRWKLIKHTEEKGS